MCENLIWRLRLSAGLEHFMMCYVTASYYHGYAYVMGTSDVEIAGLALWLPPGTDLTLMKMIKFGFGKVPSSMILNTLSSTPGGVTLQAWACHQLAAQQLVA